MESMKEQALYSAMRQLEAPQGLYASVLARIQLARQRSARLKTYLLGAAALVFGLTLIPALQYMARELYESGFYSYASLLFSDGKFVLSIWREFTFSLLESVPSIALLLVLVSAAAFVWSIRRTIINARIAFSY